MKRYIVLFGVALLFLQLVYAQDEPQRCTLNVKGMTCGGCANRVKNAVSKLGGVQSVDVSLEKGLAEVSYIPAKLSPTDLVDAINKTGFSASLAEEPHSSDETINSSEVTFYQVPLVCGAAPQIGCGGRSKPILLSLEDNPHIREAWLNREGTAIAVVWENNADASKRDDITSSIFKTYELRAEKINGKDHDALFKNFLKGNGWYRGSEVNRLSEEEAETIADRLARSIATKVSLPDNKMKILKSDIAQVFKNRLIEDKELAGIWKNTEKRDRYKQNVEKALLEVGKKHLDENGLRAMKEGFSTMYTPQSEEKKSKSCCEKH
jgi:copper chaperone CopZ